MAIFYLLHNIIPVAQKEIGVTDGQRNCRLFLLGVFLYVVIYIYMKNLQLSKIIHEEWYESLKVGFYVLIIADVFVMSFIYKDYYGRSIIHEVKETINSKLKDDYDHEYDENQHKYKHKLVNNIFLTKETKKTDKISKLVNKIDDIKKENKENKENEENKENKENKNEIKELVKLNNNEIKKED